MRRKKFTRIVTEDNSVEAWITQWHMEQPDISRFYWREPIVTITIQLQKAKDIERLGLNPALLTSGKVRIIPVQ